MIFILMAAMETVVDFNKSPLVCRYSLSMKPRFLKLCLMKGLLLQEDLPAITTKRDIKHPPPEKLGVIAMHLYTQSLRTDRTNQCLAYSYHSQNSI